MENEQETVELILKENDHLLHDILTKDNEIRDLKIIIRKDI